MLVVYSENQSEKKYLEEQFFYQANYFAVPLSNVKSLHDLIDKTCYEFYQKSQSIFIEKLKIFISQLIDLNFSFPLLRQLLTLMKKKDAITDLYRNQLITMNRFFLEDQGTQILFQNNDSQKLKQNREDQFYQALNSHKTIELLDLETQPLINLGSFGGYQQYMKQKNENKNEDDKLSIFESQRTNDETLEQFCQKNHQSNKASKKMLGGSISAFITPLKPEKLQIWSNVPTLSDKNKHSKSHSNQLDSSMEDWINSFKKQRPSAVAQMLLSDQSIGRIAKKQMKNEKQRKKLEEQLYEKTKTIKSNQYNRNIKNIILNKKLKDRKKPKLAFEAQKSRVSNVVGAYELRRVSSQIIHYPQQADFRLLRSVGPKNNRN